MSTKLIFVCLLFVLPWVARSDPAEGLQNFATLKIANFSTWVRANQLDPTAVLPKPRHFRALNQVADLNCTIRNQGVGGHSNDIRVKNITTSLGSFPVYLHSIVVDMEATGGVTFFGDYTLSGTVNSIKPITAEGRWHITVPTVYFSPGRTILGSNEGGAISSVSMVEKLHFDNENIYNLNFENLFDNEGVIGYEEYIEDALYNGFAEFISKAESDPWNIPSEDPLKRLYVDYWTEVIRHTTYEEIFATTMPPPTIPTTTPFTTTTTALPNGCPPTGTDVIPHPTSCSAYFICVEGTAYEQECAEGLHFHPIKKECDFPENINCTKPLPECPPEGVSFHPYPGNCSLYVICAEGTALVRHCAEGTCFDPEELKCLANGTVAFDIPHQVHIEDIADARINAMMACGKPKSNGIVLIPSLNKRSEFSVCKAGKYKATLACPLGSVFGVMEQDCVIADI